MSDYQDEELPDLPDESAAELVDEATTPDESLPNIPTPPPLAPPPPRVNQVIDKTSRGAGAAAEGLLANINKRLGNKRDSLKDLFETPQPEDNDIYSDDLLELDTEDVMGGDADMSDLFSVSREDIMGKPITSRRNRRMRRTGREYPPPSQMGGMQE